MIKCDEQKPSCINCVKQGINCEYRPSRSQETLNGTPLPISTLTPSSTDGTAVANIPIVSRPEVTLNFSQLHLLHHYTTVTAATLAHSPGAETFLASQLVRTGFQHAYLLHSVLAVAALHLKRTGNPSHLEHAEYARLADLHHDAALMEFRSNVREIDATNWKPVLMFAGALFPYSCTALISSSNDMGEAFDTFFTNLLLTWRVRPMVAGYYQEMMSSDLAHMVPDDVKNIDWHSAESPEETELVQLRKFSKAVHHPYPPDIVEAYGHAIHILELSFAVATRSSNSPSDALLKIWMHFVSDRYVELLSEKQPGSLIILAHYAVLMGRGKRYWYLEGVSAQILSIAIAFVPSEWSSWLDWPKAQIQAGSVEADAG